MMMSMVVPLKEAACPGPCIGQAAELRGKAGPVFQRLKLRFRIRIVVRDVRPRMGLGRSEEHTSELQSRSDLVCRLLLEKKKNIRHYSRSTTVPVYRATRTCT